MTKSIISRQISYLIESKIRFFDFSWSRILDRTFKNVYSARNESSLIDMYHCHSFKLINFTIFLILTSWIDLKIRYMIISIFAIWLITFRAIYFLIQQWARKFQMWNNHFNITNSVIISCSLRCIEMQISHSNLTKWKKCSKNWTSCVSSFLVNHTNH